MNEWMDGCIEYLHSQDILSSLPGNTVNDSRSSGKYLPRNGSMMREWPLALHCIESGFIVLQIHLNLQISLQLFLRETSGDSGGLLIVGYVQHTFVLFVVEI